MRMGVACLRKEGNVLFFFSSGRRHTRYWRDWSSDVCSSDLGGRRSGCGAPTSAGSAGRCRRAAGRVRRRARRGPPRRGSRARPPAGRVGRAARRGSRDRKSVVEGKSVDLGGRRDIKKKKKNV